MMNNVRSFSLVFPLYSENKLNRHRSCPIPQVDCISLIYGHTVNPFNRNLASGGSSGGEAVLQAMKGQPFRFACLSPLVVHLFHRSFHHPR